MLSFIGGRLSQILLTILGVVGITFALGRLTGDPVALLLPQLATAEDHARLQASLGLDRPLPVQFALYLQGIAGGDFGTSILYNRPALEVVAERILATLELGTPALILSVLLGVALGMVCARYRNQPIDRAVMTFTLAGQSLPAFFIGILLILIFGVRLGILPTFGRDSLAHLVLPTVTLTIYPLAFIIRLTRTSMLETLGDGYVNTAYAKGLSPRRIWLVHILRNALIPVSTVVGLQVATIISGAAIVETVFAYPGIGQLAVQSIGARDYPVIQVIVLLSATAFGIANLAVDVLYSVLDPRIRSGRRAA